MQKKQKASKQNLCEWIEWRSFKLIHERADDRDECDECTADCIDDKQIHGTVSTEPIVNPEQPVK